MIRIKLTKISDDHFNGQHPNGIYEGYTKKGYMIKKPTVGERFSLYQNKLYSGFSTSPVTIKLDKNKVFKTTYSTYKIEYLK